MQRVRSARMPDRREAVLLDEVVDRDRALVLDVGARATDRAFIEDDGDQAMRRGARAHRRLRRMATERACASSPSALPSAIAAGPSAESASGPSLRIEVRFMKSSTPRPDENRAERAVGST